MSLSPYDVWHSCCIKVLSDQLSLLVNLTGVVDLNAEISRLQKEKERLEPQIEQYKRKTSSAAVDQSKVPESVRLANEEKLASYESELAATIAAIEAFELMR